MHRVPAPVASLSPALPPPLLSSPASNASTPTQHTYGTRKRQNSVLKPSTRLRDVSSPAPSPASGHPRRIRPLGCATPNTGASPPDAPAQADREGKAARAHDARRAAGAGGASAALQIEFPPKHVVLHPDDAHNKVFIAIGRAFMSVNNRAMTVKDLAELTLKTGLHCQNASAAAQAITFFIRGHLSRCEVEQDCPLLLRHALSGTARDDALVPALYSRSGGNVKDRGSSKDENGNDTAARLTSFRRGTTVWYLSKAAGGPCPFARCGISLRDFTSLSSFAEPEIRKRDGHESRSECGSLLGLKRKRERDGLRRRTVSGAIGRGSSREEEEESEDDLAEERRPLKIKLTLRHRPNLSSMREKNAESSTSDSDSDSDSDDEMMSVDDPTPASTEFRNQERAAEPAWTLPPYPIQRRISIPPYTPSEESYPSSYPVLSPFSCAPVSPDWSRTKPFAESSSIGFRRAPSVPLSVASPPPDSDAEDDLFRFSDSPEADDVFSPVVKAEEESLPWPLDVFSASAVKTEAAFDDSELLRRASSASVKLEELDFGSLSLAWDANVDGAEGLSIDHFVKKEEEGETQIPIYDFEHSDPVVISQADAPVAGPSRLTTSLRERADSRALLWTDVQLLEPESVHLKDLEDGDWEEITVVDTTYARQRLSSGATARPELPPTNPLDKAEPLECPITPRRSRSVSLEPLSPLSPLTSYDYGSPPSLSGSVQSWSSPELERRSLEPASPFYGPALPDGVVQEDVMELDGIEQRASSSSTSLEDLTLPQLKLAALPNGTIKAPRRKPGGKSDFPIGEVSTPWERGMISSWDVEEHLLAVNPTFSLSSARLSLPPAGIVAPPSEAERAEAPLSPQEEEVFNALCLVPEWEWESKSAGVVSAERSKVSAKSKSEKRSSAVLITDTSSSSSPSPAEEEEEEEDAEENRDRPQPRQLRRSKRVAKAVACRVVKERLRKRTTAP